MTDYLDGKVHAWNGGALPKLDGCEVKLWFEGLEPETVEAWEPVSYAMLESEDEKGGTVVAFRVLSRPPLRVWAVWGAGGSWGYFPSYEMAQRTLHDLRDKNPTETLRVVEFVEARA